MPTEHEYKYVLSLDLLRELSEEKLRFVSDSSAYIRQGYIAMSEGSAARVRQIEGDPSVLHLSGCIGKWIFTFKHDVAGRVVEIEVPLDERDGNDLWTCCSKQISKTRYKFNRILTWELDVFYDHRGDVYFIMLEVELPENAPKPPAQLIPDFLRKHIVHEVALTDGRFSNKKLSDVNYVSQLYEQIDQGVIDASQDQKQGEGCSKIVQPCTT